MHELISAQIKLENAEKELAKMKEEQQRSQMQIVKLETEMKNRRRLTRKSCHSEQPFSFTAFLTSLT